MTTSSSSSSSSSSGTTSSQTSSNDNDIQVKDHLETLSNQQLEDICTSRGFELVRDADENTGEVMEYTHEEYVDAARQCMEIEAEMEKLLEENPDLLNEIEAESQRMLQEREKLEEELAQVEAQLLEEQRKKSKERFMSAFIQDDDDVGVGNQDNTTVTQGVGEGTTQSNGDEVIDLDQIGTTNDARKLQSDATEVNNDSTTPTQPLQSSSSSIEQQSSKKKKIELVHNADSMINSSNNETMTLPTIQEVCQEVFAQIQRDMKMLGKVILPEPLREPLLKALEPILKVARNNGSIALDMTKRYLKVFFEQLSIIKSFTATANGKATGDGKDIILESLK